MNFKSILLTGAAALALAGTAAADTPAGFYLGVQGGGNWVNDVSVGDASIDMKTGYFAGGTAGYKFDGGLRIEFELGYRNNDFDASTDTLGHIASGKATGFSQMVNALYDFDLGPGFVLSLGGGLGGVRVGYSGDLDSDLGGGEFIHGRDYVFAYQGIAELEAMVDDNVGLYLGYHYLKGENYSLDLPTGGQYTNDYQNNTAYVGVRFHFAEAEVVAQPQNPPPPPPAPAKTFIVFFNFDKSDLTPEAKSVIQEAAATFKSTGSVSIAVVGHTDTVGSAAYNLKLSERRAASVKSGLVADGVPGASVTTTGKGFSEPLVPTGPGVKEPQNRRATIDLSGSGT